MNDEPGEPLAYYNRTDIHRAFFTCAQVIKNDISAFQKISLELLSTLLELRFGIFNNLKEEKNSRQCNVGGMRGVKKSRLC